MNVSETVSAAREIAERFDIATEDGDREFWNALVDDEAFGAACHHYKSVKLYADHDHGTYHEEMAVSALRAAIREHAQRVRGELDD